MTTQTSPIAPYAATKTKFACQPNHRCRWLPMIGATIGAIPSTTPISDSILAARSPVYRSRTTARGTTATVAIPTAWTTRAAIRVSMLRDAAQTADAATKSARPAIRVGRRPNRSASGPTKICDAPQPYI